ncbi:uncharacterized protein BDZ99DRAFT_226154 [Mytilinidion resinicola]|uniref:Uncharacterized protein n=1 Tax=Mytilinidion resinicola TaxID=574789 RepID=A0A6A6YY44_9PEZI|nr:uncharacterized protein BDZ99DRAFT_226154 [Mytilinidion resinicola]KAF2813842.1 hypothetical protein BDZ99DRAFT_226154 [Mytilinidion resinicola]
MGQLHLSCSPEQPKTTERSMPSNLMNQFTLSDLQISAIRRSRSRSSVACEVGSKSNPTSTSQAAYQQTRACQLPYTRCPTSSEIDDARSRSSALAAFVLPFRGDVPADHARGRLRSRSRVRRRTRAKRFQASEAATPAIWARHAFRLGTGKATDGR